MDPGHDLCLRGLRGQALKAGGVGEMKDKRHPKVAMSVQGAGKGREKPTL
jgi:hypothetical protein